MYDNIDVSLYFRNLQPVESWFVSFISLGEGWHNYHHAFPWDYKAAELSKLFNFSADIIKFFETMGWACDLKTASPEVVCLRVYLTFTHLFYKLLTKIPVQKIALNALRCCMSTAEIK